MCTEARGRRAMASLRGLVALLVVLVAGPGFVLGSAPAAGAATCTTSGGVSVVVDYRELGGSIVTGCAPDGGGKSAAAIFDAAGVALTYATRQPGFVCRVNGAPASDPCVNASPANAYWGLWWADGSQPSWTYSSYGVGSLTVPAGGSVGWSWQQDRTAGTSVPPGAAPPVTAASTPTTSPTPSSSPTASASASPTASPTASPSGGGGSSSPSPTNPTPSGGGGSGVGPGGGSANTGSSGSSATPEATPSEPTLAPESPGDSRESADPGDSTGDATGDPSESTVAPESPGDSTSTEDPDDSTLASESPGDSSASTATEAGASGASTVDQPARVPAGITWSIVGLLAIAIAISAVVARRRRGV